MRKNAALLQRGVDVAVEFVKEMEEASKDSFYFLDSGTTPNYVLKKRLKEIDPDITDGQVKARLVRAVDQGKLVSFVEHKTTRFMTPGVYQAKLRRQVEAKSARILRQERLVELGNRLGTQVTEIYSRSLSESDDYVAVPIDFLDAL